MTNATTPRARILLVEDDPELGPQLAGQLRAAGYAVTLLRDGAEASAEDFDRYQLVVLDVMLPGAWGTDVLRALRTRSDVPVLMLSARDGGPDKVRALQLGADDYLTKPFWPAEFVERVGARLRRPVMARGDEVVQGPLRISLRGRAVTVDERPVELTPAEFEVLAALARRPGQAVTRQWLFDHALASEQATGRERSLDVHVSRIRKKLEPLRCIHTVWGVGYRFALEPSP